MTDWSRIVEEHGGIVWKTVRRLVDDDHDAADCFQETFVAALKFSKASTVRNWPGLLKRLATARALDHLRRRRRSVVSPLPTESAGGLEDGSMSPAESAHERELFQRLREGLSELPGDQAEACCLRFLEGFSYEEIADDLGVTVNHVGVLLHRAKALLQSRLAAFAPANRVEGELEP